MHFLNRSLELLRVEAPLDYAMVCAHLGERYVAIEVDGERSIVNADADRLRVVARGESAVARASASRGTLRRLLDGEVALTDAILMDAVLLQGPLEDVVAFYDALLAYFMGAVRTPAFAGLLEDFFRSRGSN